MSAPARSAVDKALDVLEVVGRSDVPLRLSEIALGVDLHRATAYRVLRELVRRGWILRTGDHYLPGTAVLQLSIAASRRSLAAVCRPVLDELSVATGLMVNLQVLEGSMSRVIDAVRPPGLAMINHLDGELLPAHRFAGPLALVAALDDEARRPFLDAAEAAGHPITGAGGLLADLAEVRQVGYAVERGRHEALVASMSRVVATERGAPICAVTIVGRVGEFDGDALSALDERLVDSVQKVRSLLTDLPRDETS